MVLGLNKEKWVHAPDVILNSKVNYQVKFLGRTEVSESRGLTVVNEALHKLTFSRELKRAEGAKPPKIDFSININEIKISDTKTKNVMHHIPLQKVSFCADDKNNKRVFAFIARGDDNKHYCYGLDSLHQASDITLTIGQAFEQAYDRFMRSDNSSHSKVIELNRKVESLEKENIKLKRRIKELEQTNTIEVKQTEPKINQYATVSKPKELFEQNQESKTTIIHSTKTEDQSNSNLKHKKLNNSDLDILSDPLLSHSPLTKKYLEKKQNSLKGVELHSRQLRKQAYLDQTIASVERAKMSLENLKNFVKKRNNQKRKSDEKKEKNKSRNSEPIEVQTPVLSNANIIPDQFQESSEKITHDVTTAYKKQEDNSLYVSIGEVMHTITKMMHENSNDLEINCKTIVDDKKVKINDLPETEIGDFVSNAVENNYENSQNFQNPESFLNLQCRNQGLNNNAPPIPPKPFHLKCDYATDTFSDDTFGSLCSVTTADSSNISSSLETFPELSYYLNDPHSTTNVVKGCFSDNEINSTLNRLSGEQGYMQLKDMSDAVRSYQSNNVDGMYDSVFHLMEKVRGSNKKYVEAKTSPGQFENLNKSKVGSTTDPNSLLSLLKQDNLFSKQQNHDNINFSDAFQNIQLVDRENRSSSYFLQENKKSTTCFPNRPSSVCITTQKAEKRLSLPSSSQTRTLPSADNISSNSTGNDFFDMKPFVPSSTSPIVRLPSPNEVFPIKSRSAPKTNSGISDAIQFDPMGEILKLENQLNQVQTSSDYENCSNQIQKLLQSQNLSLILKLESAINNESNNHWSRDLDNKFSQLSDPNIQ